MTATDQTTANAGAIAHVAHSRRRELVHTLLRRVVLRPELVQDGDAARSRLPKDVNEAHARVLAVEGEAIRLHTAR